MNNSDQKFVKALLKLKPSKRKNIVSPKLWNKPYLKLLNRAKTKIIETKNIIYNLSLNNPSIKMLLFETRVYNGKKIVFWHWWSKILTYMEIIENLLSKFFRNREKSFITLEEAQTYYPWVSTKTMQHIISAANKTLAKDDTWIDDLSNIHDEYKTSDHIYRLYEEKDRLRRFVGDLTKVLILYHRSLTINPVHKLNICEPCELPILYVDKENNLMEIHMSDTEINKREYSKDDIKTSLTRREGIQMIIKEVPKALLNQFLWEETLQWLTMVDNILSYKVSLE